MTGSRLLTWLFITASFVVDIGLLVAGLSNRDIYLYQQLLAGMALGQVAALAIWTVTGRMHRLGRGAILVLGTGLLALLTMGGQNWYFSRWLALLGIYAIVVVAAVGLIAFVRRTLASRRSQEELLRTPLIELFGWTIVAAIASFGARYMSFKVLGSGLSQIPTTLVVLGIPVVAELLYRPQFKPLHLLKWLTFVAVAGVVGHYLATRRLAPIVFAVQAAYLAAWMIVRSLENEGTIVQEKDQVAEVDPISEPN